jgi:hypothetical protein
LKYRRIQHQWVEEGDEGYGSCLEGDKIGWLIEEKCRCDCSANYAIIVVELSSEREITIPRVEIGNMPEKIRY